MHARGLGKVRKHKLRQGEGAGGLVLLKARKEGRTGSLYEVLGTFKRAAHHVWGQSTWRGLGGSQGPRMGSAQIWRLTCVA